MKANDVTKITINTPEEDILKSDIMQVVAEEVKDKPTKVYKKIGGLINLGRTYFVNTKELDDKQKFAEANLVQKYGADIYGAYISCSLKELLDLSKLNESIIHEANETFKDFDTARKNMIEFAKQRDGEWKRQANWAEIEKSLLGIKEEYGVTGEQNVAAWTALQKAIRKAASLWNASDSKKLVDGLSKGWKNFGGTINKQTQASTNTSGGNGGGGVKVSETPCPTQAMRIDITTKFDKDWFTHKFKSGFLNKMILAIKTDARSHSAPNNKNAMSGHKYTADEMLPQDERKLDSIKWKMTNKVAKDYISLLLGWSRKKEKKQGENGEYPATELKRDEGFGKEMANKALGNRGLFGRLKQKLFAGGQKSESISVAFQMADMNDGWKLVESDDSNPKGTDDAKGNDADSSSGSNDGSAIEKKTAGKSGSSGKNGGSGEGKGSTPFGLSSDSPMLASISAEQAQKNPKDATGNLAARVKRIEDEVYDESIDPFYEDFMEERMGLVKEVCEDKENIDSLIEHCLLGE